MKTTKRVLAIALAALMLAMMVPFAAYAADSTTTVAINVQEFSGSDKRVGYGMEAYQLAVLDSTTGAYNVKATDTAVKNAIKTSTDSTQAVLAAADEADTSKLGTKVATWTTDGTTKAINAVEGIYYIKCATTPAGGSVTKNSIVVVDKASSPYTFSIFAKVTKAGEQKITKTFSDDTTATKDVETGQTISYKLTADIVVAKDSNGIVSPKYDEFVINDYMNYDGSATVTPGLDTSVINNVKVANENGTEFDSNDYTVTIAEDKTAGNVTFSVAIKPSVLETEAFYNNRKVVVTFDTQLAADAVTRTEIPNYDDLTYSWDNSDDSNTQPGNTVKVKTYDFSVEKVDADNANTKLEGAVFAIYATENAAKANAGNADATGYLAKVTTKSDGKGKFDYKFKAGTYYVVELSAPANYNLNTSVVVVTPNDSTASVTISDTKSKMPATGGEGTMMFTIIGGSLILLAGALFVVVMKKRESK